MCDCFLLADSSNLLAARLQMAFTLGFHIILACLGVGLPLLMLIAEGLSLRGDPIWREMARRWSKAFAVLFAVGAVSGTVLSFELGLLWPGFMARWGSVIGLPFTLEGFAFFIEAIFAGIYLYGWDRLSPRVHWLTGIPIALAGLASAWFVVTANAWMNSPQGFELGETGEVVSADPLTAMLNPATGPQTTHMIIAAYMVSGFLVASFYAWRTLAGDKSRYTRRALALGVLVGAAFSPVQILTGDWAGKMVAHRQKEKFAAMEAHFETQRGAPLHIGGIPNESTGEVYFSIEIPKALSIMAFWDPDEEVKGLHDFPKDEWPPVMIVHLAFQVMIMIGGALLLLSLWVLLTGVFHRRLPQSKWFLICSLASGPLTVIAMEAGWVVTEVGRQPWIVYKLMRTSDAVSQAPGLWSVLLVTVSIYSILLAGLMICLRYLARQPRSEASQQILESPNDES